MVLIRINRFIVTAHIINLEVVEEVRMLNKDVN